MTPVGVVFDVDDTLYLECDYVRSGFRAVAQRVAWSARVDPDSVFRFLWTRFETGQRGSSFDELLQQFVTEPDRMSVADLVRTYREHRPTIHLLPGMRSILRDLHCRGVPLGVISDGPLVSQTAKVLALDVREYANAVLLTDSWGREFWKPHTRAFVEMSLKLSLPPDHLVYIADNPSKDFEAPALLGWRSVRLRLPGQVHNNSQAHGANPDHTVESVSALRGLLSHWAPIPHTQPRGRPELSGD